MSVTPTLPESGPTAADHLIALANPADASDRVVTIPRTAAPIPPASRAAAAGPLGSEVFSEACLAILLPHASLRYFEYYRTAAAFVMKAPNAPAAAAARKAIIKKMATARRSPIRREISGP